MKKITVLSLTLLSAFSSLRGMERSDKTLTAKEVVTKLYSFFKEVQQDATVYTDQGKDTLLVPVADLMRMYEDVFARQNVAPDVKAGAALRYSKFYSNDQDDGLHSKQPDAKKEEAGLLIAISRDDTNRDACADAHLRLALLLMDQKRASAIRHLKNHIVLRSPADAETRVYLILGSLQADRQPIEAGDNLQKAINLAGERKQQDLLTQARSLKDALRTPQPQYFTCLDD